MIHTDTACSFLLSRVFLLMSVEPMWKLWKNFLSSDLNCRLVKKLMVLFLSSNYNGHSHSLREKRKRRSVAAIMSPTKVQNSYLVRFVYVTKECRRTLLWAESGFWCPFNLIKTPNSLAPTFAKTDNKSVLIKVRPDPSFASWISFLCILRTHRLWYNFCCDCVFLEWASS